MPTQQTTSPGQKPANLTERVPTFRGLSGDRLGSRTPNSPRNQRSDAHELRKSGRWAAGNPLPASVACAGHGLECVYGRARRCRIRGGLQVSPRRRLAFPRMAWSEGPRTWAGDGDEWQRYCEQLFILHHPDSYARMPDEHKGDLGLEGYSTDGSGCAYQCYASEADTPGKRAEAQKRKMRRDLKKMRDNAVEVERHLGDIKIKRWILVVPVHDSIEVTAYAREQEAVVHNAGLDFVDSTFRVDVQ